MNINLDQNELLDFVSILLFNLVKDDTFMTGNERFNDLRDVMINKGMLSILFSYYLGTSSDVRKVYRKFKDVLVDDSNKSGRIFIYPSTEDMIKEMKELIGSQLNEEQLIKKLEEKE